jgi:REP element-mobilizing transposase RayT
MPRKARIDAPGALHHIIVRGIERRKIFRDNTDRNNFLDRLGNILTESSTSCYAWALLSNHAHLLLRTATAPIATVMRRLLTGYAVTFNRRHHRHGQLFQNRYKSILCQEEPYFLELVRYIHLNPLRAKTVHEFGDLDTYPFTGHSAMLGKNKNPWQDTHYVLCYFGKKTGLARRRYKAYVMSGIGKGKRPDLIGGGLIRSLGGWTQVKTLMEGQGRVKGDERILGDSAFVLEVLEASEEQFERRYQLKAQGYDLERLASRVAQVFDIASEEIFSPGKYRQTVKARSVFCYWAVRELGKSATEIAKELNLTQPAVSISVKRGEKIIKEKGINLLES